MGGHIRSVPCSPCSNIPSSISHSHYFHSCFSPSGAFPLCLPICLVVYLLHQAPQVHSLQVVCKVPWCILTKCTNHLIILHFTFSVTQWSSAQICCIYSIVSQTVMNMLVAVQAYTIGKNIEGQKCWNRYEKHACDGPGVRQTTGQFSEQGGIVHEGENSDHMWGVL